MDKKENLETKNKTIYENLGFQIICEKAENPVDFMINWLQKTGGYNPNGLTDKEMDELNMLKVQIENYKEKDKEKLKTKKSQKKNKK